MKKEQTKGNCGPVRWGGEDDDNDDNDDDDVFVSSNTAH